MRGQQRNHYSKRVPVSLQKRADAARVRCEESYSAFEKIYGSAGAILAMQGLLDGWKWSAVMQEHVDAQEAITKHIAVLETTSRFRRLVCMVPSPRQRKALRKLLADQEGEIESALREGDLKVAGWLQQATFFLAVWYLVTDTISTVRSAITKALHG